MVQRIAFSVALAFFSISSANAQTSSLPPQTTKIKDTQLYLSDISSIGIENSSGVVRHRIIGSATYSTGRCGAPGTKCVGIPAPQPTELLADESEGAAPMSGLGVFAACRRVLESAKLTDKFVLRGDFEKVELSKLDVISAKPQLRIKTLTSCFNYRSLPVKSPEPIP